MSAYAVTQDGGPTTERRRRWGGIFLFAAVSVTTLFVAVTGAVFSDTQSVGGNTFVTGDVEISTSPSSAIVALNPMAPGDVVTDDVVVSNAGSLALRYAVVSDTTEDVLSSQLDLTIKSGVTTCSTAGFGVDGTVVYGPANLGSTAGTNVIGDPAQGAQGGERTLAATSSETLCFQVSLPLATTSTYESLTTTATLDFVAEQTKNN
jgi:hypothetical protein